MTDDNFSTTTLRPSLPTFLDRRPNGSDAKGQPAAKTLANIALEIGEEYPVFPCKADKSPLTPRGFKDATQDPEAITRLFSQPEAALIGVPTGDVTKIVVIDIDIKPGKDGRDWRGTVDLGLTRIHGTPSGGFHYVFRYPEGMHIPNSTSKIA